MIQLSSMEVLILKNLKPYKDENYFLKFFVNILRFYDLNFGCANNLQ